MSYVNCKPTQLAIIKLFLNLISQTPNIIIPKKLKKIERKSTGTKILCYKTKRP